MPVKNFMGYIPMTSISSATFTGSYQAINATGTSAPCFAFKLVNNSNVDVTVSLDGVIDNDFIPAKTSAIIDIQSNNQPSNDCNLLKKGAVVYVKGAAGLGSVYLVGLTQPQGA